MEGFITFLFITALVIYLIRLAVPALLRWWIAKKQREFAGQFGTGGQQSGSYSSTRRKAREGEISVQQTVPSKKKVSKDVGDYVEFEEEVEIKE